MMTPAAIISCAAPANAGWRVMAAMISKMTAKPSRPSGKTMSIGWIGWPNSFALLSMMSSSMSSPLASRRAPSSRQGSGTTAMPEHHGVSKVRAAYCTTMVPFMFAWNSQK
jgi:hypothetical protein